MAKEYNADFYRNFRKFVNIFMQTFYKIDIDGLENLPTSNYLLAGNHLNILDSWLLMYAIDDNIRFMVDQKLYRHKLWENFFSSIGTFPINPNNIDITAVKTALNLLKDQYLVAIFPEGKTHNIDEEIPFKPGVPKIAVMAKKTIVPFGIEGSYKPFSELHLNIGEPIDFKNLDIPRQEYDSYLEQNVRLLQKNK